MNKEPHEFKIKFRYGRILGTGDPSSPFKIDNSDYLYKDENVPGSFSISYGNSILTAGSSPKYPIGDGFLFEYILREFHAWVYGILRVLNKGEVKLMVGESPNYLLIIPKGGYNEVKISYHMMLSTGDIEINSMDIPLSLVITETIRAGKVLSLYLLKRNSNIKKFNIFISLQKQLNEVEHIWNRQMISQGV